MVKKVNENNLKEYLDKLPSGKVHDAMAYSLLASGKRIRPNLLFATLNGYKIDEEIGIPFACALEMIHTYSLIHDDLPAMDNDDLRRGNPTCHKQFDEATAILAGDGLLTYAFEIASASKQNPTNVLKCINILSKMAGPSGMVYGQDLDIQEENGITSFEDVKKIQKYKTGCLLSAPMMMAATLANKSENEVELWHKIGDEIGLAFQIQDDILDVQLTPEEFGKSNSDIRNEKVTCVTLLGLEKAEELMKQVYADAQKNIESINDFDSTAIIKILKEIETRRK